MEYRVIMNGIKIATFKDDCIARWFCEDFWRSGMVLLIEEWIIDNSPTFRVWRYSDN
jgi:hypothetical protein